MPSAPLPDREKAEWIAVRILGALASDAIHLERFLSVTGFMPSTIRACAEDGRFLATLVDYVADDDATMQAILNATGLQPHDVEMARFALRELPPASASRASKRPPQRRFI
ncbi:DUF3572 family protein [Ancylobacter sp.]|uniref:DUF3572 family protein n=1 Tax=Ancylobacter sp. TaxID=1872567 RepID=UPI003D0DA4B5